MLKREFSYTPPAALGGSLSDYRRARGADLQARVEGFAKWRNLRLQHGLWPFARIRSEAPAPTAAFGGPDEPPAQHLNFACRDPLGLAAHPTIAQAVRAAIDAFGVHSAGAPGMLGATPPVEQLERRIAQFLDTPAAALFPSGWAAGYGAVKALARSTDHVVLDALAPAGLKEGAAAATRNVYVFRRNRLDECRRWLEKIRAADADNGILVATESLSSVAGDAADLRGLQALCHEFGATFLAHLGDDLGAFGVRGRGVLGDQGMTGKLDVVTGSLAGSFAANGGFVAARSADMTEYVRNYGSPGVHSSALSPLQAAAALCAFDLVESPEGQGWRDRLLTNAVALREQLAATGLELLGEASPVVLVKLGPDELARLVCRRLPLAGLLANLIEHPAAPKDEARLELRPMAQHAEAPLRAAAAALAAACQAGREEFEWLNNEREKLRARA
jgi:glycine C-acetyltransferase